MKCIGAWLVLGAVAATADADEIRLTERPDHVTEARIVVHATPSEIYAFVTDYQNWTAIFSDISSVKLESGGRHDGRVKFHSRALGHTVTVKFDNEPDRRIRFVGVKGPPGGRARGEFVLVPLDGGHSTEVTASLYMDVVGAPGWFVTDSKVSDMRRTKLRADIGDVARHFEGK